MEGGRLQSKYLLKFIMIALFPTLPPFFTHSGCPVLRMCCVQTSSRRWTSTTSGWRRSSARARRGPGAGRGAGPPGARCRGRPSPPSPGSRSRWATPTGSTITIYLYYIYIYIIYNYLHIISTPASPGPPYPSTGSSPGWSTSQS